MGLITLATDLGLQGCLNKRLLPGAEVVVEVLPSILFLTQIKIFTQHLGLVREEGSEEPQFTFLLLKKMEGLTKRKTHLTNSSNSRLLNLLILINYQRLQVKMVTSGSETFKIRRHLDLLNFKSKRQSMSMTMRVMRKSRRPLSPRIILAGTSAPLVSQESFITKSRLSQQMMETEAKRKTNYSQKSIIAMA